MQVVEVFYTVIIRFILISWLGLNLNRLMYSLANASALPKDGKISFDVATVKDNTLMKVRFYNADYSEDIDDGNKFPEP